MRREPTKADLVWNRAALDSGGPAPRAGDRALADLLLAHGMVMQGGVGHALEALSPVELSDAVSGYRFFGLEDAASLMEEAARATEEELEEADGRYGALVPGDQTLVERFEALYRSAPEAFAPAGPEL